MPRVAAARLAAALPLLAGVSLLSFLLLHLAPGSFVDQLRLDPRIPRETIQALVSRYGLDRPWYQQYFAWLGGALGGDLGFSLVYQRPVADLLGGAARYTLALAGTAAVLSWVGGVALGLLAAFRPGSFLDRALSGVALAALSTPTLVVAVGGLGFAAATGVFPIGGGSSIGVGELAWAARALDFARHLALPALVLAAGVGPLFLIQARGSLVEVLPSDFARAARARGLTEWQVLRRHALRVASVPLFTLVGGSVARLLNGALLVEAVTGWPGIGRLAFEGLLARDSFLILGVLTSSAALLLLGNLAADLLIAAVDPRIRLEES